MSYHNFDSDDNDDNDDDNDDKEISSNNIIIYLEENITLALSITSIFIYN